MRRKRCEFQLAKLKKNGWTKEQAEGYTRAVTDSPLSVTGVYAIRHAKNKYSPFRIPEEKR